jgi:drug/metabolite transporter (DMT)-like permease
MVRRYPKWFLAAFSVFLGAACLVAFWVGGDPTSGWISFGLLALVGVATLVFGRSELVRGLRGDGRDEYWSALDRDATLLAGLFLLVLVIAMAMWEWEHGRDGTPYVQLGALTGIVYILALVGFRLRR